MSSAATRMSQQQHTTHYHHHGHGIHLTSSLLSSVHFHFLPFLLLSALFLLTLLGTTTTRLAAANPIPGDEDDSADGRVSREVAASWNSENFLRRVERNCGEGTERRNVCERCSKHTQDRNSYKLCCNDVDGAYDYCLGFLGYQLSGRK